MISTVIYLVGLFLTAIWIFKSTDKELLDLHSYVFISGMILLWPITLFAMIAVYFEEKEKKDSD